MTEREMLQNNWEKETFNSFEVGKVLYPNRVEMLGFNYNRI